MSLVRFSGKTFPPYALKFESRAIFIEHHEPCFSHVLHVDVVDSIKLTPCPYSSCDACIEACCANPRSDGASIDILRSWSCRAKMQIPQLGIPAPPTGFLHMEEIWRVVSRCGTLWKK